MHLDEFINNACDKIQFITNNHKNTAEKILPFKNKLINNEKLVENVEKKSFSGLIAGVDSGFVSKKLSFLDVFIIRVAGAIFSYKDSVLEKADYFPSPAPLPEPLLLKSTLDKEDEQKSVSIERLKKEVSASIEIIEKYSPKYLFIDGSIIPQPQDKPNSSSQLNNDYKGLIFLFQKMYEIAEKNNTTLISCIEDSRGNNFSKNLFSFLQKENLSLPQNNTICDSALLDNLLMEGERTFSFHYSDSSHTILKDLSEKWSKKIFVFYIRPSQLDFPLRIEFIADNVKEKADEIASIVYSISSLHKEYSYPSVIIEADLRAKLNEHDINMVYEKLIDKLGTKFVMRRNSRPFK